MYVYGPFENNQLKCVNVHSENGFYIDPIGYFGAICIIAVWIKELYSRVGAVFINQWWNISWYICSTQPEGPEIPFEKLTFPKMVKAITEF